MKSCLKRLEELRSVRSDARSAIAISEKKFNVEQIDHPPFLVYVTGMVIECWICNISVGNPGEHAGVTGDVILPHFLYIRIENGLKYTFLANFVKKSAPKWCLNTIHEHHTQDMGQYKHFQQFLDFHLNHRGVTGVISGGNMAQNRRKS